jgi:catechol 2,3-dioxygenase-like lactoylglutathione lyase family enzyme
MPATGAVRQVALSAGRDLDATLAFWRDVLGMSIHARYDPPGIAFIMAGDVRLLFTDGIPAGTLYLDMSGLKPSTPRPRQPAFPSPRHRRSSIATPKASSARRGKANGWPL